ncbi:hypothetical protein ALC60_02046, partial [Trachymyrmex zeteki]
SCRGDSYSRCAGWCSPPHLNPFILDHPLHPPDSKVGFAEPRLRKKRSFAVLVRDIRTSPVVVAAVTVAAAVVVADRYTDLATPRHPKASSHLLFSSFSTSHSDYHVQPLAAGVSLALYSLSARYACEVHYATSDIYSMSFRLTFRALKEAPDCREYSRASSEETSTSFLGIVPVCTIVYSSYPPLPSPRFDQSLESSRLRGTPNVTAISRSVSEEDGGRNVEHDCQTRNSSFVLRCFSNQYGKRGDSTSRDECMPTRVRVHDRMCAHIAVCSRGWFSFSLSPSDSEREDEAARVVRGRRTVKEEAAMKERRGERERTRTTEDAKSSFDVGGGDGSLSFELSSSRLRRVSAFGRTNWTKTRRFFVTLNVLRGVLSQIYTFQLTQHPLTQIDAIHDDAAECNAAVSLLRSFEVPARSHGAYIHWQILMKIFIFMYSLFIGEWSPARWSGGIGSR